MPDLHVLLEDPDHQSAYMLWEEGVNRNGSDLSSMSGPSRSSMPRERIHDLGLHNLETRNKVHNVFLSGLAFDFRLAPLKPSRVFSKCGCPFPPCIDSNGKLSLPTVVETFVY